MKVAAPDRTKVVLVGIESYAAGPEWNLDGPANDALRFLTYLHDIGVPRDNVRCYLSPLAGKEHLETMARDLAGEFGTPTEAVLNQLFQDTLPNEQGEAFLFYWSGHGFITTAGLERRLFTSDATLRVKKNINLNNLLDSLRSETFRNIMRVDVIVDACANYIAATTEGITDHRFPVRSGVPGREQHVLCAASAGEFARNLNAEQTGLFSRELLHLLKESEGSRWPVDLAGLAKRLDPRFEMLRADEETRHAPTLIWFGGGQETTVRDPPTDNRGDQFLRRLGVFEGSFSFLACVAVNCEFRTLEIEAQLKRLLDAELLSRHPTLPRRYLLSELAISSAKSRLEITGEQAETKTRHVQFFRRLVETHEIRLMHPARRGTMDLLAEETKNLYAALDWCRSKRELIEDGLRTAGALFWFWNLAGHFGEGRKQLQDLLAADNLERGTFGHAKALYAEGGLAFMEGQNITAKEKLGQSVDLWRGQRPGRDRDRWLGYALVVLGRVHHDLAEGCRLEKEAVRQFRKVRDTWGLALALNDLGYVLATQEKWDPARKSYQESLSLWRELDDPWGYPLTMNNLGSAEAQAGNLKAAQEAHEEALSYHLEEGDEWGASESLKYLGEVALEIKAYAEAEQCYFESLRRLRPVGRQQLVADCLLGLARLKANSPELTTEAALSATRRFAVWSAETEKLRLITTPHHKRWAEELERKLKNALRDRFMAEFEAGRALRPDQVI